jgi:hypothetical protein
MTQRKIMAAFVLVVLVAGAMAMAQAPAGPPKPGPEHKRLGVFVGKWSGTGDMKPSPFGPAGKMTWTETCEWFSGNFAIVCHSDGSGPMGPSKELGVMSYNAEEKTYVYFGIGSTGWVDTSKGAVQGKTWIWTGEGKVGGKLVKSRMILTEQSNDSYTFKMETSTAGGPWAVAMEGKSTRAK